MDKKTRKRLRRMRNKLQAIEAQLLGVQEMVLIDNKPKKLLIYYGWLNAFNSATNGWDNNKVAVDMAKYDLLVFGQGVADPSHGDYANTVAIIGKIKDLNPKAKIFGYVDATLAHQVAEFSSSSESSDTSESLSSDTSSQSVDEFSTESSLTEEPSSASGPAAEDTTAFATEVLEWDALEVDGIFFDQAGYDFGTVDTNGRTAMNEKVKYVHKQAYAKTCFMNAWNFDHIFTLENDASYPNTTWNPNAEATELETQDWYLMESFAYDILHNPGGAENQHYESRTYWYSRVEKIIDLANSVGNPGINVAAISRIDPSASGRLNYLRFAYLAAAACRLQAFGSADPSYGSSSATTSYYNRPQTPDDLYMDNPLVTDPSNANAYLKFYSFAEIKVNFTASAEDASVTFF